MMAWLHLFVRITPLPLSQEFSLSSQLLQRPYQAQSPSLFAWGWDDSEPLEEFLRHQLDLSCSPCYKKIVVAVQPL